VADSTKSIGVESGVVLDRVSQCRPRCSGGSDPILRNVDAASEPVKYDIVDERCSSDVSSKCDSQGTSYRLDNAPPARAFKVAGVR
jgi:hypothetical protein